MLLCRGIFCDGARHSFEKKGIVTVSGKDQSGNPVSLDKALELAIESGAEDVQEEEDEDEKAIFRVRSNEELSVQCSEDVSTLQSSFIRAGQAL